MGRGTDTFTQTCRRTWINTSIACSVKQTTCSKLYSGRKSLELSVNWRPAVNLKQSRCWWEGEMGLTPGLRWHFRRWPQGKLQPSDPFRRSIFLRTRLWNASSVSCNQHCMFQITAVNIPLIKWLSGASQYRGFPHWFPVKDFSWAAFYTSLKQCTLAKQEPGSTFTFSFVVNVVLGKAQLNVLRATWFLIPASVLLIARVSLSTQKHQVAAFSHVSSYHTYTYVYISTFSWFSQDF